MPETPFLHGCRYTLSEIRRNLIIKDLETDTYYRYTSNKVYILFNQTPLTNMENLEFLLQLPFWIGVIAGMVSKPYFMKLVSKINIK